MISESKANSDKILIERTYRARIDDVWDLWTTKEGFESWWGPEGFRSEVQEIDARTGGLLRYEMIADAPEMVAWVKERGQPVSSAVQSRFTEVQPRERLVLSNVIDFLPGVPAYESRIVVDFAVIGDSVRMTITLGRMHSDEFTRLQQEGMRSQLTKLDARFA